MIAVSADDPKRAGLSREALIEAIKLGGGEFDKRALSRALGLKTGEEKHQMRQLLEALEAEGTITRDADRNFALTGVLPAVCVVEITGRDIDGELLATPARVEGQTPLIRLAPGEGKGGPAGHAKITASVALKEDGAGTILIYDVNADIGGKLAQLGGHLVENTARKLAGEFFRNFEQLITTTTAADEAEPAAVLPPTVERGTSPLPWVIGLAALLGLVGWLL